MADHGSMNLRNERSWETCTETVTISPNPPLSDLNRSDWQSFMDDSLLRSYLFKEGVWFYRLLLLEMSFLALASFSCFSAFYPSVSVWIIHDPWLTRFLNRKKFALRRKHLIRFRSAVLLILNRQRYMRVCAQRLHLCLSVCVCVNGETCGDVSTVKDSN